MTGPRLSNVTSVFARTGAVAAANGDYEGVVATALTGATAATRYVGGTASGAPVAGTFAVGDFVVTNDGHVFVCTTAGTPGTWVDAGSVSDHVTSVFTRTGAVIAQTGDYSAAQVSNAADKSSVSTQLFQGGLEGVIVVADGLTGATTINPPRWVGSSASGAPSSGTWQLGDWIVDKTGVLWICVIAGTPGTWTATPAGAMRPLWTAAKYYRPEGGVGPIAQGLSIATFAPLWVPAVTVVRIAAQVTTAGGAGSVVRLGIYADNGAGRPGARILDAGTIDGTSQTAQEITISQALTGGLVWVCAAAQVASCSLTGLGSQYVMPVGQDSLANVFSSSASNGYYKTIAGALPDPAGAMTGPTNACYLVALRAA